MYPLAIGPYPHGVGEWHDNRLVLHEPVDACVGGPARSVRLRSQHGVDQWVQTLTVRPDLALRDGEGAEEVIRKGDLRIIRSTDGLVQCHIELPRWCCVMIRCMVDATDVNIDANWAKFKLNN